MLEFLKLAVEGAKRNHRHSGICGQAPSDFPEIAEYLVRLGIDSMSLTPDTVIKTTLAVLDLERSSAALPDRKCWLKLPPEPARPSQAGRCSASHGLPVQVVARHLLRRC